MFDQQQLSQAIRIQEKSYMLLMWIDKNLKKASLDFSTAHTAMSEADAAADWITRNYHNLPVEARPTKDELRQFATFFSSYLTTSFDISEKPGGRLRSECGCYCPICSYLGAADNLTVRNPSKKARKDAEALKRVYVKALAGEIGSTPSVTKIEAVLSDPELSAGISLATYAQEMMRRTQFASQGHGVLSLWREIAWEHGGGPKKDFRLSAKEIIEAEEMIAEGIKRKTS